MRLKKLCLLCLLAGILMLSLTACKNDGTKEQTPEMEEESSPGAEDEETIAQKEETKEEEGRPADTGQAILYYASETGDNYERKEVEVGEVTPQRLLEQLEAEDTLPAGQIQVQAFTEKEEGGETLLHLDLSGSFAEYLMGMGSTGELVTMGCVVNTFLETYEASGIAITVDGETLETGHQEYSGYLKHYGDMTAAATE